MADKKELPLALIEIFKTSTDKDHILSAVQIRKKLESKYGLTLERRTLYSNIDLLEKYGYKISSWRENNEGYYLTERQFRMSEIRNILNALHAAPFLSAGDVSAVSRKLLETLSSSQRRDYSDDVYLNNTGTRMDPSLTRPTELIAEAIQNKCCITFSLLNSENENRSAQITVEPRYISFIKGRGYLIATLPEESGWKYYRIDRMADLAVEEEAVSALDPSVITPAGTLAVLPGGEQITAVFHGRYPACDNLTDFFGTDISIEPISDDQFRLTASGSREGILKAAKYCLGHLVLMEPADLRAKMAEEVKKSLNDYTD